MGGGWEHEESCCFHGHCPELSCQRLLPSHPHPSSSQSSCHEMGVHQEDAAALCHWEGNMGAARMCCSARASPAMAAFPCLPCRGCDHSCSSAVTHISQSQSDTGGRAEQMPECAQWTLGRALPIFPMAIHVQSMSGMVRNWSSSHTAEKHQPGWHWSPSPQAAEALHL